MTKANLEKVIETDILDYLNTVPGAFFWKNNSGGVFDPTKRVFRKNTNPHIFNGVSDILGLYKGQMVVIEVKRPKPNKTYPSQAQKDFIARVDSCGGAGYIARSVEDAEEIMEDLCGATSLL